MSSLVEEGYQAIKKTNCAHAVMVFVPITNLTYIHRKGCLVARSTTSGRASATRPSRWQWPFPRTTDGIASRLPPLTTSIGCRSPLRTFPPGSTCQTSGASILTGKTRRRLNLLEVEIYLEYKTQPYVSHKIKPTNNPEFTSSYLEMDHYFFLCNLYAVL